jgi:ubiquinone/menaquinone biosynthesis C-methylase UbiE
VATGSDLLERVEDECAEAHVESKRDRVRRMFGRVASGYDRLNTVLSMGLHHRWRRFAVRQCDFPAGRWT